MAHAPHSPPQHIPPQPGIIPPADGGAGRDRDPLPHHRDLPGQEVPDQDPDLEPTIGEDGPADADPEIGTEDGPSGVRSIPI